MLSNLLKLPAPVSLLMWAGIWEIIGLVGIVEIFPPFHKVILTMADVLASPEFQNALVMTGQAWAIGLGFAIVIGIPIGVLMGLSRWQSQG